MNVRFFKSLSLFIFFVKGVILVVQAGKGNYANIYKKNNINIFNCMKRKYDKKLSSSVVNTNDKALYESSILKYYYLLDKYKKPNRKKIYGYISNVSRFPLEEERKRKKLEHMNKRNIYPCYNYDAKDIVILEGLEAVRKRPGMYIGNTDVKGLHQILFEIIDNSVDEYNNFECNTIKVVIHKDDSVTIEDNGRGIPCDVHEKTKKSALETVLTVLHSGAKFFDDEMDDEIDNNMNNTGNTNTSEKNNRDNISNNNNNTHNETDVINSARNVALKYNCAVVVTSKTDYIVSPCSHYVAKINCDLKILTKITGSGCSVGALCAAATSVYPQNPFIACISATLIYKLAAFKAYQKEKYPGSLSHKIIDDIYYYSHNPHFLNFQIVDIYKAA